MNIKNQNKRMRVNLYLTRKRSLLFEHAFDLLQKKGMLDKAAELDRSRTMIVDHALEALIRELDKKDQGRELDKKDQG